VYIHPILDKVSEGINLEGTGQQGMETSMGRFPRFESRDEGV
jgi:hypothetical protein